MGAIASEQQYNKILDYIDQARRARARLQLDGEPLQVLFAIEEFTELRTIQLHLGARSSWWAGPR